MSTQVKRRTSQMPWCKVQKFSLTTATQRWSLSPLAPQRWSLPRLEVDSWALRPLKARSSPVFKALDVADEEAGSRTEAIQWIYPAEHSHKRRNGTSSTPALLLAPRPQGSTAASPLASPRFPGLHVPEPQPSSPSFNELRSRRMCRRRVH